MSERLLDALRDVADNDGMMWRASGYEAERLWRVLKKHKLVEWNSWAGKWLPSEKGRDALKEASDE